MKLKGRRIVLLIASALPLLANQPTPDATATIQPKQQSPIGTVNNGNDDTNLSSQQQQQQQHEGEEGAAEIIHDDSFHQLPQLQNLDKNTDILDASIPSNQQQQQQVDIIASAKMENVEKETTATAAVTNGNTIHHDNEIEINKQTNNNHDKNNQESSNVMQATETEPASQNNNNEAIIYDEIHDKVSTNTESTPGSFDSTSKQQQEEKTEIKKQQHEANTKEQQQQQAKIEQQQQQLHLDLQEDSLSTDRLIVDYASKSAGALILEKSPNFQGTSNLLNSDKDKYAIAPCEEPKKTVVIGLSEDILVKQVKLSNYERYSSRVKDFQILGSQTMGTWFDLGTYTAKSMNGVQSFDLYEPAWVRYLKFRFKSHHGSEYYCTVSQIQVHGSTMLQGFHEQWEEESTTEDNDENHNDKKESISSTNEHDNDNINNQVNEHAHSKTVQDSNSDKVSKENNEKSQHSNNMDKASGSIRSNDSSENKPNKDTTQQQQQHESSTSKTTTSSKSSNNDKHSSTGSSSSSSSISDDSSHSNTRNTSHSYGSNSSATIASTNHHNVNDDNCHLASIQDQATATTTSSSSHWHYRRSSSTIGPLQENEYLDDVLNGRLSSDDQLLFKTIYELIPRTLNSVSSASVDSSKMKNNNIIKSTKSTTTDSMYLSLFNDTNINNNMLMKGINNARTNIQELLLRAVSFDSLSSSSSSSVKEEKENIDNDTIVMVVADSPTPIPMASNLMGDDKLQQGLLKRMTNINFFGGPTAASSSTSSTAAKQPNKNVASKSQSYNKENVNQMTKPESSSSTIQNNNNNIKEPLAHGDSFSTDTASTDNNKKKIMTTKEQQDTEQPATTTTSTLKATNNGYSDNDKTTGQQAPPATTTTTTKDDNKVIPSTPLDEKKVVIDTINDIIDSHQATDLALAKLLERLPSSDCLKHLDFGEFKSKSSSSKKGTSTSGGPTSSSSHAAAMEPIFKKLTDEIKALHTSLHIHEQFTKMSVSCYQRVLLDLILDVDTIRIDQQNRLSKLEEEFHQRGKMVHLAMKIWDGSIQVYTYLSMMIPDIYAAVVSMPDRIVAFVEYYVQYIQDTGGLTRYSILLFKKAFGLIQRFLVLVRESTVVVEDLLVDYQNNHLDESSWLFSWGPAIIVLLICRILISISNRFGKKKNVNSSENNVQQ